MERSFSILSGSTFVISGPHGDIEPLPGLQHGFFALDTRFLSRWELRLGDHSPRVISIAQSEEYALQFFLSTERPTVYTAPLASVIRERAIEEGWTERVVILNHGTEPLRSTLTLTADADFADLFEVKDCRLRTRPIAVEREARSLRFRYHRERFVRETRIGFDRPAGGSGRELTFGVEVPPRGSWSLNLTVEAHGAQPGQTFRPRRAPDGFALARRRLREDEVQFEALAPRLTCPWEPLSRSYRKSLDDLSALRLVPPGSHTDTVPAAGLPWFMALFGRDSIITSLEVLPFLPELAASTLRVLAARQGGVDDPFRDEEPGKILHELRVGELTAFADRPHSPYYGTADATPLFLILLDEYVRWTGDTLLGRRLQPHARAALQWIERYGDRDGDGYVEYLRRNTRTGLANQCWKDSWNAIQFADGTLADGPLAVCEIQGYVYDARLRVARMARELWDDPALADEQEERAAALRAAFRRDFWIDAGPDGGYVALALDGEKRRVDARTSNMGHLLWSGILDQDQAVQVAATLMDDSLFGGWGVRTMSTRDVGYNPLEYHNGTVWPHDNALIAAGLARYGLIDEAQRIAVALLRAANRLGDRLPEVFAGYSEARTEAPVSYPTSSSPQAWAAGAPMLLLSTLLGLDVRGGQVTARPRLPAEVGALDLEGLRGPWGVAHVHVPAGSDEADVHLMPLAVPVA